MASQKAVQEALDNARIVALARQESVPATRPPGESLFNVTVAVAEHELRDNPDFRLSDLPDDPRETLAFYEALPEGQRAFKMKTKETFHERTMFAPDAAEACERAEDVVLWEFSPDEWGAVSVAPV